MNAFGHATTLTGEAVALPPKPSRAARAALRYEQAIAALGCCQLCAHRCKVNRLLGDRGKCHAGAEARVFTAQTEVSDELTLIPTFAIAFSGCDLRCAFCITGKESWNPNAGEPFDAAGLAEQAREALEHGARSIMILGGEPTIYLPHVLQLVAALPDTARLIWKTNAHATAKARELLDGLFDVWLADYKFGNDWCAKRLAQVDGYTDVVRENLLWASRSSELIIRHLVMPGHVECCWRPNAQWIADTIPDTQVNLRSGFWPAWQARKHPELRSRVSGSDAERALAIAREYELRLIE